MLSNIRNINRKYVIRTLEVRLCETSLTEYKEAKASKDN